MSVPAEASRPRALPRLLLGGESDYGHHLTSYGSIPPVVRGDDRVLSEIEASGLTGRGGAAFPTATKLASVARSPRRSIIANGTEGEPASAKDKILLARNPHLVLDGLAVAARLIGASGSTIAVAGGASVAARAIERAIRERPEPARPALVRVPDSFVAGEESALLSAVEGGGGRPTGRRPFESGVLVQNVETLAHLALVARFGADWFRTAGTDAEPGTALATVRGAVATPGVIEFELGTTLGRMFERCGGLVEPVDAVLIGGYFGRWIPADPDIELTNAALASYGASLGARVIVALPRSACGLVEVAAAARYMAEQSAGQCGPCVFGLSALADELDGAARRTSALDRERIARLERQIARRGVCAHPDGTLGFVTSGLALFADELELHRRGRCSAAGPARVLPVPGAER